MKKIFSLILMGVVVFALVGCSGQEPGVNISVGELLEDIKGQMAEDMKAEGMPEDSFKEGQLPGFMETDLTEEGQNPKLELFNKEDIEEGIILEQMTNVKSDLIILIKAKEESKVESLKASLEKVKEGQVNIWSNYLPDQYEKVENNIIKAEGNYLIYITHDQPEKIEEIFNNALK